MDTDKNKKPMPGLVPEMELDGLRPIASILYEGLDALKSINGEDIGQHQSDASLDMKAMHFKRTNM